MKGMAILLSKGRPQAPDDESSEGEDETSVADSDEFVQMFDAFTESLGVKPKDEEAARRRLSALFGIWCSQRGY